MNKLVMMGANAKAEGMQCEQKKKNGNTMSPRTPLSMLFMIILFLNYQQMTSAVNGKWEKGTKVVLITTIYRFFNRFCEIGEVLHLKGDDKLE